METSPKNNTSGIVAGIGVYIDVVINGQKVVYEVPTARALHTQLGLALQTLDQQIAVTPREDSEKAAVSQPRKPRGPVRRSGRAKPPATS